MQTLEQELEKQFLILERMKPDSLGLMTGNLDTAKKNILSGISNNQQQTRQLINRELKGAFDGFEDSLLKDVEDITVATWNTSGALMASILPEALANNFNKFDNIDDITKKRLLNENNLVMGSNLKDHKNLFIFNESSKLRGAILQGLQSKVGIDEITRSVDGIIGNLARNKLRTVIRTATLSAINEAKKEQFQAMLKGDDDIVYYYNAVMDTRTSKRCFQLNNYQSNDIKEVSRLLNYHYNCRSLLGVTSKAIQDYEARNPAKDTVAQWNTDKTVNHRDGTHSTKFKLDGTQKVARSGSAETYFKAYDTEYQIKYAGRKNYDLWKSKKISFDDMMGVSRNTLIGKKEVVASLSKDIKVKVPKVKAPTIKFGYEGKFDGYVADIRDEAKIVIDKLPKPNNIKIDDYGLYNSSNKTLVTSDVIEPKRTFAHEYGHHIDFMLEKDGQYSRINPSLRLFEPFEKDRIIDTPLKRESFANALNKKGDTEYAGLFDILDAQSNGTMQKRGYIGHGAEYWKDMGYNEENFANMFQMWSEDDKLWKYTKDIFPNTTKEFELIMKELADE